MEELMKQFKKSSIKNALFLVIILIIFGLALFFMNGSAVPQLFSMFADAPYLDELPESELDNRIATCEVYAVYDCFAEYETSHGSLYDYYIIPYGEDADHYIAVQVKESNAEELDYICDDTWAYLSGESDTLDRTVTLKGNVRKMDSDELYYYEDWFREMEFTSDEMDDLVVNYVLVDGKFAEDISPIRLYLASAGGVVLIIISIYLLVKALSGKYLKKLKDDFAKLGTYAENQIATDYANAYVIDKGTRIGRLFTYDANRIVPRAYLNSNIAWVYQHRTKNYTNGIYTGSNYSIMLFHTDSTSSTGDSFGIKKKNSEKILEYYDKNFPHMVVGYSDELRDLYHRDRASFLNLRYNTADAQPPVQPLSDNGYDQLQ